MCAQQWQSAISGEARPQDILESECAAAKGFCEGKCDCGSRSRSLCVRMYVCICICICVCICVCVCMCVCSNGDRRQSQVAGGP